ncbi:MAG: sugar phosphate isomerase/epimerase family protein, partial [bacterium]
MKITPRGLAKLNTTYKGWLEGDRIGTFFHEFNIKFAAGHWCAGDFADRFAPDGYNSNNPAFRDDVVSQIARTHDAGITAIEFHERVFIDRNYRKDPAKIREVKDALKHYGMYCNNMNINCWSDPKWKLGAACNPDPAIRKDALALLEQAAEIAAELGCATVALWPGSDGWDYHFQIHYGKALEWYIHACTVLARAAKKHGIKAATEPKMHEPREMNMIINTVAKAALVCQQVNKVVGKGIMGINIDYGHEQMANNTPADSVYMLKVIGVPLAASHINESKPKSNDEDRVAGSGDWWRMVDYIYATIDTGFNGHFAEDQFTYRDDPTEAMAISREMFANIAKRALLIWKDRDVLIKAQA